MIFVPIAFCKRTNVSNESHFVPNNYKRLVLLICFLYSIRVGIDSERWRRLTHFFFKFTLPMNFFVAWRGLKLAFLLLLFFWVSIVQLIDKLPLVSSVGEPISLSIYIARISTATALHGMRVAHLPKSRGERSQNWFFFVLKTKRTLEPNESKDLFYWFPSCVDAWVIFFFFSYPSF